MLPLTAIRWSLTDDAVHALTERICTLDELGGGNTVMNAQTLPRNRMPNRNRSSMRFPGRN